ncbi:MAG: glucan biosynthesis protein G [Longimicrobiales bacterium]|nr:glucan biosynthesis protein G [Longimicrobiales bacterium]
MADANGPSLFDHVTEVARQRAGSPYHPPRHDLVESARGLEYDQYRDIRFRDQEALWKGEGAFEIQLFHPGGASDVPVRVHLVEGERSRTLDFDPDLFRYGEQVGGSVVDLPPEAGFAGFRILHPMNSPEKMDEVAAFLGASYFRLVGPGQVYGLSARGLAVDIAEPSGEEFPDFVEWWLVKPDPAASHLTFYGLLDSPSVAGAYRFVLVPGSGSAGTEVDVTARLFFRSDVRKVGVAPLTSMYLHGPLLAAGHDDIRPRVHDSEGLSMLTADGEWIWRPLTNGRGVRVTSLRDVDPAGYGLVQRSRDFDEYLDLEALYHRRPSLWVDVADAWGPGGVELLEIPTRSEFNDNVVAYWVPGADPRAGEERTFRYRLVTFDSELPGATTTGRPLPVQTVARVVRTRIGWDALPGEADPPPRSRRRVVVDFQGGGLEELAPDVAVTTSLSTSSGTISDLRVQPLPGGGRRVTFALEPDGDRGADMRLFLTHADTAVSETWSYLWEPDLVR